MPVLSITTSTSSSPQGSLAGSRSANAAIFLPSTIRYASSYSTSPVGNDRECCRTSAGGQRAIVGQVIDGHDFELVPAFHQIAERQPPDATKAVNCNCESPLLNLPGGCRPMRTKNEIEWGQATCVAWRSSREANRRKLYFCGQKRATTVAIRPRMPTEFADSCSQPRG